MSVCLSVCLSVGLSVCLLVGRSVCLSVCRSVCLCLSVCWSVSRSVCVCLSVCRSVCLSACLSVNLSVCLSVCLSACQWPKWHKFAASPLDLVDHTYIKSTFTMCQLSSLKLIFDSYSHSKLRAFTPSTNYCKRS